MRNTFYSVDKAGHRTKLPFHDYDAKGPVVWAISGRNQEDIYFVGTRDQMNHAGPDKNGEKPKGAS
jgi:hypothetical protein